MPPKEYKILLLGSGGVGKTPLIVQFVSNKFSSDWIQTLEDSYTKQFEVDGEERILTILDTGGVEELHDLHEILIKQAQGIVLVYSVDYKPSFNEINGFYDNVIRVKGTNDVPIVLVGNKCDRFDNKQVSTREGEELAQKWKCPFIETSAKDDFHVRNVFVEIVKQIDEYERTHPDVVEEDETTKKRKGFFGFFKRK